MAVRLSLKLGVVNERDRVPDSPDTIVVVEPTIGSVARSKGNLYLLVTSAVAGGRAREATRIAAETIRDEYYYDESAGIRACIEKVIGLANKRLAHHRDKVGVAASATSGPVGVALAIVRGPELYVATVGPAEAYLIRGARLSTLPDPNRDRGLPATEVAPDVWRGELQVGDSLVLVSPNVVARLGLDELKDAVVTLHPQSAMEHLHHRFVAADGRGSDGAISLEATEVSAITRQRTLVPVRPAEPLAGMPDRSPIPLADSVTDGVAAMSAAAGQARDAAGGAMGRGVRAFQDLLPQRGPTQQRVTPFATRQETQRRAAFALLAFVVVVGGLGFSVWLAGGSGGQGSVASLSAGQRALESAREDIDEVWAPGVDLVDDDPGRARDLLEDAYASLGEAEAGGIPDTTLVPLRRQVVEGLDELFGVVAVRPSVAFAFPLADPLVDLRGLIQGPDGRPFVIDRASGTVLRIEPKPPAAAQVILRAGDVVGDVTVAAPKLLAVGGPDLLILDADNNVWRWTPADKEGRGTLSRWRVRDSPGWGSDVRAMATFCRAGDCSLYNLYVVDPSEQQILTYTPAADGSGYPGSATGRLATARDVSSFDDLYIDGDIFASDNGVIERFVSGRDDGWKTEELEDELLRPAPSFARIASGSPKRQGLLYAFDEENARVVGFEKVDGAYVEQYRLVGSDRSFADMRGMYVVPGVEDGPATLWWVDRDRLLSAVLEARSSLPRPSSSGSPQPSGSLAPSVSPSP
jgi:hypothetical protein